VASAGPYASLHLDPDKYHASTPPLSFFTGWMPFLPPNQQRQSTEGMTKVYQCCIYFLFFNSYFVSVYRWPTVVSGHWNMMNMRLKMSHTYCKIALINSFILYLIKILTISVYHINKNNVEYILCLQCRIHFMSTFSERHVTIYHYNDTRLTMMRS